MGLRQNIMKKEAHINIIEKISFFISLITSTSCKESPKVTSNKTKGSMNINVVTKYSQYGMLVNP